MASAAGRHSSKAATSPARLCSGHVLATADGLRVWESPRIDSRHTHGTGCTLASAIAAGLAQGLRVDSAVERAREYVRRAILSAPGLGRGHGPLDHAHPLRAG